MSRITRQIITGFFLFVFMSLPSFADDIDDALAAFNRGEYATAFKLLSPLAEQGDIMAMNKLSAMYFQGHGVPQDYKVAVNWRRLAAEQGDTTSQYILGRIYFDGKYVPQDYKEAMKWYRLAAEQGDAQAQFELGLMYDFGQGVPQDKVSAYLWYELAAAQGHTGAITNFDVIARNMTPAQLAEAQQLAREWKPSEHESQVPASE